MNPMLMALLGQAGLTGKRRPGDPGYDALSEGGNQQDQIDQILGDAGMLPATPPPSPPPPDPGLGELGVSGYDAGQGPGGLAGSPEYQAWDAARKTSGAEGALQGQMPSRMMEMINRLMMQYRDR